MKTNVSVVFIHSTVHTQLTLEYKTYFLKLSSVTKNVVPAEACRGFIYAKSLKMKLFFDPNTFICTWMFDLDVADSPAEFDISGFFRLWENLKTNLRRGTKQQLWIEFKTCSVSFYGNGLFIKVPSLILYFKKCPFSLINIFIIKAIRNLSKSN